MMDDELLDYNCSYEDNDHDKLCTVVLTITMIIMMIVMDFASRL